MEKIKQALELARQQRQLLESNDHPAAASHDAEVPPTAASGVAAEPPSATAAAPAGNSNAEPSRTRVKVVDSQVARRNRILAPGAEGPAIRSYRILRTQVLQRMKQEGYSSLAVVSPDAGDGKTVTALNLGIAIGADADHTALVVDLDLRNPGVAPALGLKAEFGVDACLRGERDVAEVLIAPKGYRQLVLLPAAAPVEQSSELLGSERAAQVLSEIVQRYPNRIVIFDLPPLLHTDDALALLPRADAALLVIHEGRTRREDVERSLDLMRKIPVIGTVLNGSRELAAGSD